MIEQNKNTVEVCFTPAAFPLFYNPKAIVVVIDVLRATSAICTALHYGVKSIIPVASVEEAIVYKNKGFISAAERNGELVEGFEIGNSPFSYMDEKFKGKEIVLSTTNGTQAIEVAKEADTIVIGSFLNKNKMTEYLLSQNKNVILLCAGWKNKFNMEDTLFAGAIVADLLQNEKFYTPCDSAMASLTLYKQAENDLYAFLEQSSHRRRLEKLQLEKDIRYCLTPNTAPVIPIYKNGKISI
jgi:2-phosphosulfolactate phosphatase